MKLFFRKRIQEPELMEKLEYHEFEKIFLKNYEKWTIPIIYDVLQYKNDYKKILDVGCGPGLLIKELALNFNKSLVYGLDYSRYVLKLAKKNCKGLENVKFVHSDISKTKFSNDFFDLIICKDSFHHFKNPNLAIKEMLRILKKDGVLYIQDLRRDVPWYILKTVIPPDNVVKKLIYYSVRAAYTKKEVLNILNKNKIKKFIFKIKKPEDYLNIFKKENVDINLKELVNTFRSRFVLIIKK